MSAEGRTIPVWVFRPLKWWHNTVCAECRDAYNRHVYLDFNDWWIGYYHGPNHHYVCLLPTLVIRWSRRVSAR